MTTTPTITDTPQPVRRKRHWKLPTLIGFAAFILGATMAAAGSGSTATETVTKTVPGPTVTKTVPAAPVAVTPASCVKALDLAAEFATAVADEHQAISDAANEAADSGDVIGFLDASGAAAETLTARTHALGEQLAPLAADCREHAATD